MDFVYQEGVLDGTGVASINVGGKAAPMTATLKSAAGGRKIELATVAGELYTPVYDANTATMLNVSVKSPALTVKFTGAIGDIWSIR